VQGVRPEPQPNDRSRAGVCPRRRLARPSLRPAPRCPPAAARSRRNGPRIGGWRPRSQTPDASPPTSTTVSPIPSTATPSRRAHRQRRCCLTANLSSWCASASSKPPPTPTAAGHVGGAASRRIESRAAVDLQPVRPSSDRKDAANNTTTYAYHPSTTADVTMGEAHAEESNPEWTEAPRAVRSLRNRRGEVLTPALMTPAPLSKTTCAPHGPRRRCRCAARSRVHV
jgi:hypothetical protein